MTVRILADFHHHALAESLLLLFADRFGAEVWFPHGMGWYDSGTWQFERAWHGDRVARQYLEGIWAGCETDGDGRVVRPDPRHPGRLHWGITYDAAIGQGWDIVLSSLPHNDPGYHRFAQATGARFGVQVGNALQDSRWDLASFVLASSTMPGAIERSTWARPIVWNGLPTVIYHQEFSLDTFRPEWPPAHPERVGSFVNCFPEGPSYPEFQRFARAHGDGLDFRVFGAYGTGAPDEFQAGDIGPVPEVAETMRSCGVIWHSKHWSDGFGHTVHNAFAIGRPVVGIPRYYADKLAGPLFVEGVTSFDIEGRSFDELAALLHRLRDDTEYHRQVSEAAAERFREIVDFDAEADAIGRMLGL